MSQFLLTWLVCAVVFLAIDLTWLGVVAKSLYRAQIGHLMAARFRPGAAFLFYAFYVAGIVWFCVHAASDWQSAAFSGALFGFFCYATYDMTNYATLRDWPLKIVVVDIVWGTILTAVTAGAGWNLLKLLII